MTAEYSNLICSAALLGKGWGKNVLAQALQAHQMNDHLACCKQSFNQFVKCISILGVECESGQV